MGDAPPEELYDLDADPWAVKNLAADTAHTEALARMRNEMKHWRESTADRDVHPSDIKRRTITNMKIILTAPSAFETMPPVVVKPPLCRPMPR